MDKIERAFFITNISQARYLNARYSRIYFGNEFCERLIPAPGDLKEILSFIRRKNLQFSLVTPYVTNKGLKKLETLFLILSSAHSKSEVIINDWGVLNLINNCYASLEPVLGRLLTKQKRCPTLERLLKRKPEVRLLEYPRNPVEKAVIFAKKLPLSLDYYYKGSNVSSVPAIHNFLNSWRIRRIELDNPAQGLFLELPKDKISASIYFPYDYITTTFFCPTAGCDEKKSFLKLKPCKKQCRQYLFKLRHKTMPKVIYLKGNTKFYKNTRLSIKQWQGLGVDRMVFSPEVPV